MLHEIVNNYFLLVRDDPELLELLPLLLLGLELERGGADRVLLPLLLLLGV
jgi:hypothetical protein